MQFAQLEVPLYHCTNAKSVSTEKTKHNRRISASQVCIIQSRAKQSLFPSVYSCLLTTSLKGVQNLRPNYKATMSTTRREHIARNQRTTLRNGAKLIDALRAGPKTSFTTSSKLAPSGTWRSLIARAGTPKNWENAFAIGQPGGSTGKLIIGQMFKMMYENALDLPDEANWIPVKPLGNGSFGAAALFKHEDGNGGTDDVSYR